jgi:lipid-A-disaccharide synthase
MNPRALADAVLRWLDDPAACEAIGRRFMQIHLDLRRNTAQAATAAIAEVCGG